jgi:amino acid adenylation domain-containing protein
MTETDLKKVDLDFWKHELCDLPILEMITDKERAPILSSSRDVVTFEIDLDSVRNFRQLCLDHSVPLLSGLMTVLAICMCRHTTQSEICIGHNIVENKNYYDVAILLEINGNNSFLDILTLVARKMEDSYNHRRVKFADLVQSAALQPDSRRNLVYQSILNYWDGSQHHKRPDLCDNICEFILEIEDFGDVLKGSLHFSIDLYLRDTVERLVGHLLVLFRGVTREPSAAVDSLVMLTQEEVQEYIEWDTTDVDFGQFTRVDRMFEQITAKYPNQEALRMEGNFMTYEELNDAANSLANKLFVHGIEVNEKVGLVLDRSFDMFIAILAVLKVGGVIVPIDIAHTPMDRIEYMFSDSAVRFIVVHDVHESKLIEICDKFTMLSWSALMHEFTDELMFRPPEVDVDTEAVFGIFYTSGTTGRPKGVMNMHRNIFNLAKAYSKYSDIQINDRILQFASYSFIQSLRQIWPTLCSGACLVLVRNPLLFGDVINEEKVNKLVITASALSMLNSTKHPTLQVIQLGGEAVPMKLALAWNKQVKFMVGLGPTELTAHACCNPNITTTMNIGTPHDNVRCYITNSKMQLQPKGCMGELCIAGANVAKGYLNLEQATREKFIQNPFINKPEILYKTGDLALRLNNGNLSFIGRRDDQVKIHGYRIELAEIQRAIEKAEGVEKAAVLVKNDQLCAYVSPNTCNEADIKQFVASRLPKYMVPSHIVLLDRFPLNKNGKLDRAALPDPFTVVVQMDQHKRKKVPKSKMELLIAASFASVLNLSSNQQIFVSDNFFELGGSSLTVAILARHLSERTNMDISIVQIFELKTVEGIAEYLQAKEATSGNAAKRFYWSSAGSENLQNKERPIPFWMYNIMQSFCILVLFAIQIGPVILDVFAFRAILFFLNVPMYKAFVLIPAMLFATAVLSHILVISCKWLLVGRLKPGIYPMYSYTFFKWWLNRKIMSSNAFWLWLFSETPFYPLLMRLLGAQIGPNAQMDMVDMEEPDLVSIGSNFIGQFECAICTSEIIEKSLVLRNVTIGNRVCMGKRSIILPGSTIPDNVEISGGSSIDSTVTSKPGDLWSGCPAKCNGQRIVTQEDKLPPFIHSLGYNLGQVVAVWVLLLIIQWPFVFLAYIAYRISKYNFIAVPGFLGLCGAIPVLFAYLVVVIVAKWLLIGCVRPHHVYAGRCFFLRRWIVDRLLVNPIFSYMQPSFLTYCSVGPMFFRLLGVSIGWETWMAPPMFDAGCNVVSFGHNPHLGQHNVFFTATVSKEGVMFQSIQIGDHVTFGQRCIVSPDVSIGNKCTLGAMTYLPTGGSVPHNHTACGSPAILFETTLNTKGFTAQLQAMAKNELRRSISLPYDPATLRASMVRGSITGPSSIANVREAITDGCTAPQHYETRMSLFHDAAEESSFDSTPLVQRVMFSYVVYVAKLILPFAAFIIYTTILLCWKNDVFQTGDWTWLIILLPLTYLVAIFFVAMLLLLLTSLGLLNFRSGLMNYYSLGFLHWYIFTDVVFGWMQMIMTPISGTGLYITLLRVMGAEVGEGVYVDILGGLREVNNIVLRSGSVLLSRFIYAHYIDNGKLQFAPVIINENVCINKECMIMPLTTYEKQVTLRPYSSTVKGQIFQAHRIYQGHPATYVFDGSWQPRDNLDSVTLTPLHMKK